MSPSSANKFASLAFYLPFTYYHLHVTYYHRAFTYLNYLPITLHLSYFPLLYLTLLVRSFDGGRGVWQCPLFARGARLFFLFGGHASKGYQGLVGLFVKVRLKVVDGDRVLSFQEDLVDIFRVRRKEVQPFCVALGIEFPQGTVTAPGFPGGFVETFFFIAHRVLIPLSKGPVAFRVVVRTSLKFLPIARGTFDVVPKTDQVGEHMYIGFHRIPATGGAGCMVGTEFETVPLHETVIVQEDGFSVLYELAAYSLIATERIVALDGLKALRTDVRVGIVEQVHELSILYLGPMERVAQRVGMLMCVMALQTAQGREFFGAFPGNVFGIVDAITLLASKRQFRGIGDLFPAPIGPYGIVGTKVQTRMGRTQAYIEGALDVHMFGIDLVKEHVEKQEEDILPTIFLEILLPLLNARGEDGSVGFGRGLAQQLVGETVVTVLITDMRIMNPALDQYFHPALVIVAQAVVIKGDVVVTLRTPDGVVRIRV